MQERRCFTQIYADLARRFTLIMFHVDLRRSALLICGNLREILSPGLRMQDSRCFTQIYADLARRFTLIMSPVDLRRSGWRGRPVRALSMIYQVLNISITPDRWILFPVFPSDLR